MDTKSEIGAVVTKRVIESKTGTENSEDIIQLRRRLSLWGDNLEIDGFGDEEEAVDSKKSTLMDLNLTDTNKETYVETYVGNSKQGYNPSNPYKKKNQDSYIMERHSATNTLLFGVFDGHGVKGDEVSQFVAYKFSSVLYNLPEFVSDIKVALTKTCSLIVDMLTESGIDTQLSGTTLCVVAIRGTHIYTCNIGDSRAMGIYKNPHEEHLSLKVLTHDHKPTDPEESSRIEAAGGRVETVVYDDGFTVTRVWMQRIRAPGLAMSRSIGDRVAHTIGVSDIPDVQDLEFTKEMKYIILSSDGLFEFVSGDLISSVVEEHTNISACVESLFSVASQTWLEIEGVIDDITIIIIKLKE